MYWLILFVAGLFEVVWAVAMKYATGDGNKIIGWSVVAVGYVLSSVFLALAMKKIPLGTSYAIWTGIGILGTTIFGILFFKETISFPQLICVLLILAGIIGLKLLSKN